MPKRVLFLCTGNYYRSRLAEGLFNHRIRKAGLDWQASSCALAMERGTEENVGPISEYALKVLLELDLPSCHPTRFPIACTERDLKQVDLVVAMKEAEHRSLLETRFNAWAGRVLYWNVHDLDVHIEFAETGNLIDALAEKLIDDIHRNDVTWQEKIGRPCAGTIITDS